MPAYRLLEVEIVPPLASITLNRPPLNVINVDMMRELRTALDRVATAPGVKMLAIRGGHQKAFCAGTDVGEHLPPMLEALLVEFRRVIVQLLALPVPSVAVVQGDALGGGCELIAACDMVIAAEEARFGQPEIKLGVFPPIADVLLPRLVGPRRAAEMIYTGEPVSAARACEWGLVNRVVARDELEKVEAEYLAMLAPKSGAALRLARRALAGLTLDQLTQQLEALERRYLEEIAPLPDANEGLHAFLEKRVPRWSDEG